MGQNTHMMCHWDRREENLCRPLPFRDGSDVGSLDLQKLRAERDGGVGRFDLDLLRCRGRCRLFRRLISPLLQSNVLYLHSCRGSPIGVRDSIVDCRRRSGRHYGGIHGDGEGVRIGRSHRVGSLVDRCVQGSDLILGVLVMLGPGGCHGRQGGQPCVTGNDGPAFSGCRCSSNGGEDAVRWGGREGNAATARRHGSSGRKEKRQGNECCE